jgi:UDP:flavonoid glycosyltransferase YjiC (YdhE family)
LGRFLFVVWDGGGNVPQPLALARRLVGRGHAVEVVGSRSLAERFRGAGCVFTPFRRAPELSEAEGVAAEDERETFLEILSGEGAARDVLEVVEVRRPDVAVVDFMLGGPLAALEAASVDTALLVHVLYRPWAEEWGRNIIHVNPTRKSLGLPPLADATPYDLIASARSTLVLHPAELDRPTDLPATVAYVGPVFDDEPHPGYDAPCSPDAGRDELPLVVVSMSTTYQHQEASLALALDGLEDLAGRVLVTLGHRVRPADIRFPANASSAPWIPHRKLFPEAALVVTHAGLGTVLAALACGVPLLCLPLGREQPLNAERVQELGAGLVLSPTASESEVREAAQRLLAEPSFRESAQRLATAIAGYGDGERAIEALEALLSERPKAGW